MWSRGLPPLPHQLVFVEKSTRPYRRPARRFELHSVGEPPTGDEGGAALSTPAELRTAIDRLAALCSSPLRVAAELLDKVEGASRSRGPKR